MRWPAIGEHLDYLTAQRWQVTVWSPRQEEAGEQAQIDYGQLADGWTR